ncbi:type II toxin-antitoxin system HicB family antitoxin [Fructobacillus fructosus]|uniref:type II toxin-antitoxin system HicB family antitoxin n=1 Tax=Fructobacillus fructosus TaxID=1631 RepID=UPI0016588D47|nr:type II toxin-antitoxin system HicB family antitoxin [Fructobacillus fructosus]MBC9118558.1 type II toxin-antitoxin system HicB family antitoxin [Fructobacillus fructosus]MBD9365035.1 type II toxin-antitoxin system HicB family antitoxin [Leuconostoc mesenteroides]
MTEKIKFNETYPVIIHEEDGQYWANVPDIPSAFTIGYSVEEVLKNLKEAIELALSSTLEVPTPTKFDDLHPEDGFVQMVNVSLLDYLKAVSKTVRKNVTVPSYLGILAKQNGDNVSEILTQALEKTYGIL